MPRYLNKSGCGCSGCFWTLFVMLVIGCVLSVPLVVDKPASSNRKNQERVSVSAALSVDSSSDEPQHIERHISASFNGILAPGTVIDTNAPITVTCYEPDGTSNVVEGWSIDEPITLAAYQHQSVIIRYDGLSYDMGFYVTTTDPALFDFSSLDSTYEPISMDEFRGDITVPVGKKVRASFMVEHIFENADGTTDLVYLDSSIDPPAIVTTPTSLAKPVNDHTEITFYGIVASRTSAENAGEHTDCFRADYIRVDSRELEQYVKPNQVSPCRKHGQ